MLIATLLLRTLPVYSRLVAPQPRIYARARCRVRWLVKGDPSAKLTSSAELFGLSG